MRKLKSVVKPQYLKGVNFIAILILIIGAIMRLVHAFKMEEGFNFFFFISSIYFLAFIAILTAIIAHETNKFSVFCRTYFNFLDKTFGRGVFMLFLSFMMVERNQKKGEVFMCVLVAIIAILNMIFGYGDAQKKLASLPWEKSSASSAPVGQPGQQQMGGNGLAYDSKTDTYQVNLDGAQARAAAAQGVKEGLGIASQGGNFND